MLGFEGDDLEGLKAILERLSQNSQYYVEGSKYNDGFLTRKQVRAYGRGLLLLLPSFNLPTQTEAKLKILIACMSTVGLPLYDRAFFAGQALEEIKQYEKSLSSPTPGYRHDWDRVSF